MVFYGRRLRQERPKFRARAIATRGNRATSCVIIQEADRPVLSRVRAFLPELAASNDALFARAREDPSSVSIENPTGSHVAMDLGVGVFDVKGDAAVPGNVPVVEGEEWTKGESESESDSSEDEEEEEDVQIKEAKTTRKEKND